MPAAITITLSDLISVALEAPLLVFLLLLPVCRHYGLIAAFNVIHFLILDTGHCIWLYISLLT